MKEYKIYISSESLTSDKARVCHTLNYGCFQIECCFKKSTRNLILKVLLVGEEYYDYSIAGQKDKRPLKLRQFLLNSEGIMLKQVVNPSA